MTYIPNKKQKPVLKQIFDCLLNSGFDCYFPASHKGECISEYIVVRLAGSTNLLINVTSERPIYDILCYVPHNRYSDMEIMKNKVKQTLKQLYPLIKYIGNETPAYYDEEVKGYMCSFQYQGIRKINNF